MSNENKKLDHENAVIEKVLEWLFFLSAAAVALYFMYVL